jgi:hypothetical protein
MRWLLPGTGRAPPQAPCSHRGRSGGELGSSRAQYSTEHPRPGEPRAPCAQPHMMFKFSQRQIASRSKLVNHKRKQIGKSQAEANWWKRVGDALTSDRRRRRGGASSASASSRGPGPS